MTLPRSLDFKDRFVYELVQIVTGSCAGTPIAFPDNTTPIRFVVEMNLNEFTKVLSALMNGADLSYPEQAHDVVWMFLRQVECPVSICDEIIECLQPLFDALSDQIEIVQTGVDAIQQTLEENAARPPEPIVEPAADAICAGATAVVEYMHNENMAIYAAAEAGFVDQLFEFIPVIIEAIPVLGQLPFDEMFEIVNAYFENQVEDYEADYNAVKNDLICDLKCFVEALHGDTFTFEVWGEWLDHVGESYPGNRAASVFSRYSPTAQTFINQIAALINGNQSLQAFFDELYQVYFAGTQNPTTCVDCECEFVVQWADTWLFNECGEGDINQYSTESGATQEVSSQSAGSFHYVALNRRFSDDPVDIEVVSVTGATALPGSENAWGYHDAAGTLHTATFGSGATIATFGTQETKGAVYEPWCSSPELWGFNVVFFSATPFTVTVRWTI